MKHNRKRLTLKEQRFVTAYIKTGNASEAVRQAGYEAKDIESVTSMAYELIRRPIVAAKIQENLTKHELSADWVLAQIRDIAVNAEKESTKDRLKALELIGKHLKMFGEAPSNNFNGDFVIQLGGGQTKPALPAGDVIDVEPI